jgi:hypothetical protein
MIEVIERRNKTGGIDFIPVVDGKEYSYLAETYDVAMLLALQIKYDGLNSQFCKNACRMLGIQSAWAE